MSAPRIVLGVDFDNTIVGYDKLFHRVARELGAIPENFPANKNAVRDHLNANGKKDVFTEMQGTVYGARMTEAEACPGAVEALTALTRAGVPVFIISHKTKAPLRGAAHDLHAAARGWLELNGFFDPVRVGLARENVFFEETKDSKLARVAMSRCTHFVDDLPEILFHKSFPPNVRRILYETENGGALPGHCERLRNWTDLPVLLRQP